MAYLKGVRCYAFFPHTAPIRDDRKAAIGEYARECCASPLLGVVSSSPVGSSHVRRFCMV